MGLDSVLLARIQFAATVGFHFIFPPITIGLAWLLVIIEYLGWRKQSEIYAGMGKFFSKILALTFAMGVATGVVMEFQFGTNWAEYSKFVGDIFGAPLAAEGVFAFFMESAFLGLYLFGRNKLSRGLHWFSIFMVALGSTISAFWILVANSWQQTPAGFVIRNGRAELTDFWAAVFNPSTVIRFLHTVDAALITGAFIILGVSAYLLLKNKGTDVAKEAMKLALIFGLVVAVLELFPIGHEHGREVAHHQPAKFAAIEGLYTSRTAAPLVLFGIVNLAPPELKAKIEIPGLLSWMAFGSIDAHIPGINSFPPDDIPPLWLTFVSFHNMVVLGMYFIGITLLGVFFLLRKRLFDKRWYLKILLYTFPLPILACQFGWMATEVGRQPWVVYNVLRTVDAASINVTGGEILFSLILFGLIYIFLFALYVYVFYKEVSHGPQMVKAQEVRS